GEPKIRFDIIEKVSKNIEAPIVLHGGSGVPDESIRRSISLGVGKINVNTENQVAFTQKVRALLEEKPDLIDPRKYLGPAREAIKEVVKEKMRLFGSSGKACAAPREKASGRLFARRRRKSIHFAELARGGVAVKLFIDSADVNESREAQSLGSLSGFTTIPTLVAKTGRPFVELRK